MYTRENFQSHTITIEYSLKQREQGDISETRQMVGTCQTGVGEGHLAGNQSQYWADDLVH